MCLRGNLGRGGLSFTSATPNTPSSPPLRMRLVISPPSTYLHGYLPYAVLLGSPVQPISAQVLNPPRTCSCTSTHSQGGGVDVVAGVGPIMLYAPRKPTKLTEFQSGTAQLRTHASSSLVAVRPAGKTNKLLTCGPAAEWAPQPSCSSPLPTTTDYLPTHHSYEQV